MTAYALVASSKVKVSDQSQSYHDVPASTFVQEAAALASGPTAFAFIAGSASAALTGTGSTKTDALQLVSQVNSFNTVVTGVGCILPAASPGLVVTILNAGAGVLSIYGHGSDTIDGHAAATGTVLTNAKRAVFICPAAATWISAQLGVVSA